MTVVLGAGGYLAWGAITGQAPTSLPPCSWSLRVHGHANGEQAGLIRCYLRDLAHRDTNGLQILADTTTGPVHITSADLGHSADARAGMASATFSLPGEDDVVAVKITFADHVAERILVAPEATTGTTEPWRLAIGEVTHRIGGPLPTKGRH